MNLPNELWALIHSYLDIKDFCWPNNVPAQLRKWACFCVRRSRAKAIHGLFTFVYRYCVVDGCTSTRGVFRDLVVSPYCVHHACKWSCPRVLYFRVETT
jgi:hypothetical protein